jgi:type III pantothenate kinase
MILCIDVGNSHIFAGVFAADSILLRFRLETRQTITSDQIGVFLKNVLRENNLDPDAIKHIAISSVVPSLDHSLGSACIKYFKLEPFWLRAGARTGLKLKTKNPNEIGADLIATAIAAVKQFPNQNVVVVDFGTATTYVPIAADKTFLGVVIEAGIRTSMLALQLNTAQLPTVQINKPEDVVGRDTVSSIQAGLYYGQLGALREIIKNIKQEIFNNEKAVIIGTGGFSSLFENEKIFNVINPDLVLQGIKLALEMNLQKGR